MPRAARGQALALAGVLALAAALRFPTLGLQSYWYDEAATVSVVGGSLAHALSRISGVEGNPPLYYLLAWVWARAFGTGEVALRSLSALAGTALVGVCFAVGRRIGGQRAGIATAALVATAPFLVWFSQEARAYSLLALLVALALLSLLRGSTVGWALCSALALATHYFAALFVVPMALWLLLEDRTSVARRWAVASVAIVGAALLQLAIHQHQAARGSIVGAFGTRALQLPKQLLVGYNFPGDRELAVIVGILVAAGIWWALRRAASRDVRLLLALAAAAFGLVALLAAVSLDYLDTRNMIALDILGAAVAGAGFATAGRAGAAAVLVLCVLGTGAVIRVNTDVASQRDDWRGAVAALGSAQLPRAIVATPLQGRLPLALYLHHVQPLLGATADVAEIDLIGMAKRATGERPHPPAPTPVAPPAGFTLIAIDRTAQYTVARYRATSVEAVPTESITALRLGVPPAVDYLQTP